MVSCIAQWIPAGLYESAFGDIDSAAYMAATAAHTTTAAAATANLALRVPSERYSIIRPIQTGSTARVYLAIDTVTQKQVALKKISGVSSANFSAIAAEVEAQQAVQSHDNVAKVYEVTHDEMMLEATIVMEYCNGGDLIDMVAPDQGMEVQKALKYALEVAQALAHMHESGWVHRDIKSENVTISSGSAKLIDFGMAVPSRGVALTHRVAGTTPYIAPEVYDMSVPTTELELEAADVWSFGIMLFSILSGRFAWKKASMECREFSRYVRNVLTPAQAAEWARIPADVRTLLQEILAVEVKDRLTMAQVCERLQHLTSNNAEAARAA